MVKQGDIIKLNFNPTKGHEQAGYRPAIVISNNFFNKKTNLAIVCPITNTEKNFPLHFKLENTKTKGFVLCQHIKSVDLNTRGYKFIETAPQNILNGILDIVFAEIESI